MAALIWTAIAKALVPYFVGADFVDAAGFIGWIALGHAFMGMYKMVANYLFYIRASTLLMLVAGGIAIVNAILGYVLIGMHGSVGAAQATMASYLLAFVVMWLLSAKYFPMPWLRALRSDSQNDAGR